MQKLANGAVFLMLFQSTHARSIIPGSIIAMENTSSTHVCSMYTECACMRHINQNPAFMCRHHNKISIRRRIYLFWERQSSGRTTNTRVLSFEAWLYMSVAIEECFGWQQRGSNRLYLFGMATMMMMVMYLVECGKSM